MQERVEGARTKAPFVKAPYQGYIHREVPSEDVELTHVGPGTPCGEYLRRFWQPVAFSHELTDRPKAVTVMGEELVLFRDLSGRVGLLELHCAHRGTSLEFGRIAERGIRCCYHGWLYDVDGRILETPTEPPESTLKDRLFHGAYPLIERHGLVWTHMGPPGQQPVFPNYDIFKMPGYRLIPAGSVVLPCNWLQNKENIVDPFHTVFLHAILSVQFSTWHAQAPQIVWTETELGMIAVAARRIGEYVWSRVNEFILPNIHQFATDIDDKHPEAFEIEGPWETKWSVPIDNTSTRIFRVLHAKELVLEGLTSDEENALIERMIAVANVGEEAEGPYEDRQRHPGDFEAQTSQRPIAVHALERLGATDRGITMLRKQLRDGIRAVGRGEDPKGLLRQDPGQIQTYAHQRLMKAPPEESPEAEREQLRAIAESVAASPERVIGRGL